jgi:hypothetical protein
VLYSVNAITSGSTESQGEVTVRLQHGGRVVNGVGSDPDIVVASAKAYLSALNKLHSKADAWRPGLRSFETALDGEGGLHLRKIAQVLILRFFSPTLSVTRC